MLEVPSTQKCFHSIYVSQSVLPTLCWLNSVQVYLLDEGDVCAGRCAGDDLVWPVMRISMTRRFNLGDIVQSRQQFGFQYFDQRHLYTAVFGDQAGNQLSITWTTANQPRKRTIPGCAGSPEADRGRYGLLNSMSRSIIGTLMQNACLVLKMAIINSFNVGFMGQSQKQFGCDLSLSSKTLLHAHRSKRGSSWPL